MAIRGCNGITFVITAIAISWSATNGSRDEPKPLIDLTRLEEV